jgi:3-methyladenine DNA glycosylase AlkD
MEWIEELAVELKSSGSQRRAIAQAAYMKNHFVFCGVESAVRKENAKRWIQKYSLKSLPINEKRALIWALFQMEQREFHYTAIDFLNGFKVDEVQIEDGAFIEKLLTTNSWWDSVDGIASNFLGAYVKKFPEGFQLMEEWSYSENIWLMRSTLIFQLKYGKQTDFEFLKERILQFQNHKEFFIQKAIGWSLRQYSKFNKEEVRRFISVNQLSNLARREASKYL